MNYVKNISAAVALASVMWGCASVPRSADSADGVAQTDCQSVDQARESAWPSGVGAPAGQGQIGYGRSLEDLHQERNELAASCVSHERASY